MALQDGGARADAEAENKQALARGTQALCISLSRRRNMRPRDVALLGDAGLARSEAR